MTTLHRARRQGNAVTLVTGRVMFRLCTEEQARAKKSVLWSHHTGTHHHHHSH